MKMTEINIRCRDVSQCGYLLEEAFKLLLTDADTLQKFNKGVLFTFTNGLDLVTIQKEKTIQLAQS